MTRHFMVAIAVGIFPIRPAGAQIFFSAGSYSQNFDSLAATNTVWINNATLPGWYCHRAEQNRPEVSDSKPATLKYWIHIISCFPIKGFSLRVKTSRTG